MRSLPGPRSPAKAGVQFHRRAWAPAFAGERKTAKDWLLTDLPTTMIAIDPAEPGGPEVLIPVERPVPVPGPGELLIKVAAAGVNRPDVMQRMGNYPPPKGAPSILGLELAGGGDRIFGVPAARDEGHDRPAEQARVGAFGEADDFARKF